MCGIWGVMLNNKQKTYRARAIEEFLGEAAVVGSMRGMDATGVMRVDTASLREPALIYKKAVSGADFIQLRSTAKIIENVNQASFIIGHNRKGTSGKPNRDANAHPFQSNGITLVHNGHVNNAYQLGGDHHDVDSAVITSAIAGKGADAVLPKLKGAYCLVWHDAADGSMNIARNMDRPLHWIALGKNPEEFDGWLLASEMEMLWWLIERNKLPHHGLFLYPEEHVWYKFDSEDLSKFTAKKYEPEKEVAHGNSNFTRGADGRWTSGKEREDTSTDTRTVVDIADGYRSRSDRRLARKLAALGFKLDEHISVVPKKWEGYRNQKENGKLICEHKPFTGQVYEVQINDVRRSEATHKLAYPVSVGAKIIGLRDVDILIAQMNRYNMQQSGSQGLYTPGSHLSILGPDKRLISKDKYHELTKDGCAVCSADIYEYHAPSLEWRPGTPESPVCTTCQNNDRIDGHKRLPGLIN